MERLKKAIAFAQRHRGRLAWLVLFLSGGFAAVGLSEVSVPMAAFAFWLRGGTAKAA